MRLLPNAAEQSTAEAPTEEEMSNIKVLGPEVGYVEILNTLTQEIIDERAKEPSKYNPLRPSSAGKCTKELGFEFMEYRGFATYPADSKTPEVHRLLNFGYHVENHVINEFRDAFKRMPKPIEIKYKQHTLSFFKLTDGTRIEGNIDLVLVSEKFKCVADIKSKKDKFSAFYKTSWEELTGKLSGMKSVYKFGEESYWVDDLSAFITDLDDPFFAANFYQLNLYFFDEHHFLREKGVDHAAILQLNKNDSRMREIRFRPSEKVYEETKTKFLKVQEVIDRDKSPDALPKDYVLGGSKCGFCRFRKECWPDDDALKAHFATWPKKFWPKDLDRLDRAPREQLTALFEEYERLGSEAQNLEKVETEIIRTLDNIKVRKVRLDQDRVYEVRQLKSGGVGGGARAVLRRTKV
jgi:CRISPR/Cas system-associated exonuclease Cas4 (RecB family)